MRGMLVLCALLCGCAAHPRAAPASDALIVVFADDFHSGIIMERTEAPAAILPAKAEAPWIVVHFGERRWIRGEADGLCDAVRLGVCSGDGGVQVDAVEWWVHDRGGTERSRLRVWAFPVSRAQLAGLRARLDTWFAPGAVREPIRPGSCWWPSSRGWSVRTNCHDFTVDLLVGAGIVVDRPAIMLAGPLRAALDRAWSELDEPR